MGNVGSSDLPSTAALDERAYGRLRGKVVIVTGGGRGIGRAAVRRFGAEGASVVVADIDEAATEVAVAELQDHGVLAAASCLDVSSFTGAERLIAETIDNFGRVDVLVNNVGGATKFAPYVAWDEDAIVAEIGRSLWPTAWCCRAVLPFMLERGYGRIVNVGAESVRNGLWDRAPYSMAKGAVHALTTSIARETAATGVTCNCVAPAATGSGKDRIERRRASELSKTEVAYIEELGERTRATIPMQRTATNEEQAAAIAFLASDDASFITGQVLSVNGGSSML